MIDLLQNELKKYQKVKLSSLSFEKLKNPLTGDMIKLDNLDEIDFI